MRAPELAYVWPGFCSSVKISPCAAAKRTCFVTAGAPEGEGEADGDNRSGERAGHVDPVVPEVASDQVGPNVRGGNSIEAPEIGLPQRPASAM